MFLVRQTVFYVTLAESRGLWHHNAALPQRRTATRDGQRPVNCPLTSTSVRSQGNSIWVSTAENPNITGQTETMIALVSLIVSCAFAWLTISWAIYL